MNNLFTTLTMISAANPGGFTYNVNNNCLQSSGYAVALNATQNSFGAAGLESVINLVAAGTLGATCIGGWLDEVTGLYYYDAVVIVEDRDAAIILGREQQQIAIFDLSNSIEIRL